MTSDDGSSSFLGRWSRRKQAMRATPTVAEPPSPELHGPEAATPELPPVEGLGAASDYSVFLQQGVAAAVQAQALHKAWTSDAGIAGFRGMADYDWDFNATGYGRLWQADNVPDLLQAILGPPKPDGPVPVEAAAPEPPAASSVRQSLPQAPEPVVAALPPMVAEEQPSDQSPPRRHGSALPA